jgi:hypothetical protein
MGEIIQGLDVMDIVTFTERKNKKFQAILLQDLEEVLDKDGDEYKMVRKLVLDCLNNYTRSILRTIFGNDFEQ